MKTLTITSLEGAHAGLDVEAQFNPKEISVDKAIPWQQQPKKGPGDLEFSGRDAKTMSFELLFDNLESATSIQPKIGWLDLLSEADASLKRPPKVKVVWGSEGGRGLMPRFDGVIEALAVSYLMFDPNGIPLRATVGLRLREANNLKVTKPPQRVRP